MSTHCQLCRQLAQRGPSRTEKAQRFMASQGCGAVVGRLETQKEEQYWEERSLPDTVIRRAGNSASEGRPFNCDRRAFTSALFAEFERPPATNAMN
jgi:hypothetical protein